MQLNDDVIIRVREELRSQARVGGVGHPGIHDDPSASLVGEGLGVTPVWQGWGVWGGQIPCPRPCPPLARGQGSPP